MVVISRRIWEAYTARETLTMLLKKTVHLYGAPGEEGEAEVEIDVWSTRKRLGNALVKLVSCWIAAALAIFIPVAHFFLMPAFFIAGIVGAWFSGRRKGIVVGTNAKCPRCATSLDLNAAPSCLAIYRTCNICHQQIFVEFKNWAEISTR